MKNDSSDRIVYSINVGDIQEVAQQVLERDLMGTIPTSPFRY